MVRWAVDLPGSLDRRYEEFTRNETNEWVWYLVRRYLNYSIDEWERLPWTHQRVYLKGIREQYYQENGEDATEDPNDDWDTIAGAQVTRVVE